MHLFGRRWLGGFLLAAAFTLGLEDHLEDTDFEDAGALAAAARLEVVFTTALGFEIAFAGAFSCPVTVGAEWAFSPRPRRILLRVPYARQASFAAQACLPLQPPKIPQGRLRSPLWRLQELRRLSSGLQL